MHRTDKYLQHSWIISLVSPNCWVFIYKLSGCGFGSRCSHLNLRYPLVLSKEFLCIQTTIECRLTLKRVRDIIRTYSQMHSTDKYSQYSLIVCPVWLNGWVFVYELSGCEFESRCRAMFINKLSILVKKSWSDGFGFSEETWRVLFQSMFSISFSKAFGSELWNDLFSFTLCSWTPVSCPRTSRNWVRWSKIEVAIFPEMILLGALL